MFSHQELAIASFLDVDSIYLMEDGIREGDGVLGAIQGNVVRFSDKESVGALAVATIKKGGWVPSNRKELRVEEVGHQMGPALSTHPQTRRPEPAQYYQFRIKNLSHNVAATDCYVQVTSIRRVSSDGGVRHWAPFTVEMKFAGIMWPRVTIAPESERQFDGVILWLNRGSEAVCGVLNYQYIDSIEVMEQYYLSGPGDFQVRVIVNSSEFSPAQAVILVHLDTHPSRHTVRLEDQESTLDSASESRRPLTDSAQD